MSSSIIDTIVPHAGGIPEGFGSQDNPTFSTTSSTYNVGYTIPILKFKPGVSYIVMIQWQIHEPTDAGISFRSRVMFNGSVLPNGEFLGESSAPNVLQNCFVLTRITQPSVRVPITIELRNGDNTTPIELKHVRWVVFDESTIDPDDYEFSQTTTPVLIGSSLTNVLTGNIPSTNENWTTFYCNKLAVNIPFSNVGINVTSNFKRTSSVNITSRKQGFNGSPSSNINRVTTMMLCEMVNAPSGGTTAIEAQKHQYADIPNAIAATGSIFSIRTAAFQEALKELLSMHYRL